MANPYFSFHGYWSLKHGQDMPQLKKIVSNVLQHIAVVIVPWIWRQFSDLFSFNVKVGNTSKSPDFYLSPCVMAVIICLKCKGLTAINKACHRTAMKSPHSFSDTVISSACCVYLQWENLAAPSLPQMTAAVKIQHNSLTSFKNKSQ